MTDMIVATKAAGFDLIIVETPGIGQGDAGIVPYVDLSLYVMTPEFGAASQLEKIDMLDFANAVAINKFDRQGAQDALRDVAKQIQRNREEFATSPDEMPVYGTIASRFNDLGVTAQRLDLPMCGYAAVDGDHLQVGKTCQRADLGIDLRRQLARRSEHEHTRSAASLAHQALQERQREGRRLAGSGLCAANDVLALKGGGNPLLLYGGRFGIAGGLDGSHDVVR